MATATKQINQYNAANSIDPVNDQLLIDPAGTGNYLKINRNTYLGVSGTPMDISTTQNVSNKTFQNSNSYTAKDGSLTIQNTADTTKQAKFSLSGITTGNTRTITLPDYNATMASLAGTETLTNKTLTAPTISGGSIDNATITVDAISGHTSSNTGTIYGISIASAKMSGASLTNATVGPNQLATGAAQAIVSTSQTTTSTSYADLATVGPTVTVTIGANGLALVATNASITNSGANYSQMSFALSGANTQAALDNLAITFNGTNSWRGGGTFLLTGLLPGSTTFTAKYDVTAGTGTFTDRRIVVVPL